MQTLVKGSQDLNSLLDLEVSEKQENPEMKCGNENKFEILSEYSRIQNFFPKLQCTKHFYPLLGGLYDSMVFIFCSASIYSCYSLHTIGFLLFPRKK
jgi:hypothetical protein